MNNDFRNLPSVDRIVSDERVQRFGRVYPHDFLVRVARRYLEQERLGIASGKPARAADEIIETVINELSALQAPSLRPVINATGVVLHTNLGRAPLSRETLAAMEQASRGYSNLESDVESGTRGSRQSHIEPLLCYLTGAEAALVVNNNASAVLLALAALAKKKEVIVSRGQAVEIGDSFRIPDVMRQSGVRLVEVGTTNCTYVTDYEQAITGRTAGLMRVHSSNFQVVGFTHTVTIEELASLGKRRGLPVLDDLGSGCFLDTTEFGLMPEPTVQQSIAAGAGLVFFSGDKLVGGPQSGIIVGDRVLVDKLRKHPLARAVRVDKIRLAGLAATLIHYLKGEALEKVPVWRMISSSLEEIQRRAETWAGALGGLGQVIDGLSTVGGGSLPGGTLPTRLLAIRGGGSKRGSNSAQSMAQRLRRNQPPIIGRISGDMLLLDPRTVFPDGDGVVMEALRGLVTAAEISP